MFETKDLITVGESLIELSSSTSLVNTESFNKSYGGDTLISAISAIRTGANVGYITKVGNDHFGEYLLEAWGLEGLDISQVKLINGINGIYFLAKENEGHKTTYYRKKTSACELKIDDINFDYIKSAKCVYATGFVQSLSLYCAEVVREIFKFAKENNITTAYDVNFSEKVWSAKEAKEAFEDVAPYIDILILNAYNDAPAIFGLNSPDKIIKQASDMAIPIVIVREKEYSNLSFNGEEIKNENIKPISENVDITGSSACFNGIFLGYYMQKNDIKSAFYHALCAEFLQKQKTGAILSIPNKEEIEEQYQKYYG